MWICVYVHVLACVGKDRGQSNSCKNRRHIQHGGAASRRGVSGGGGGEEAEGAGLLIGVSDDARGSRKDIWDNSGKLQQLESPGLISEESNLSLI